MDPVNFAYWLQSQFELGDVKSFDKNQTEIIKNHALLVLKTVEIVDGKQPLKQTMLPLRPGVPPHPSAGDRIYKC